MRVMRPRVLMSLVWVDITYRFIDDVMREIAAMTPGP
jgi:hypothetical protein